MVVIRQAVVMHLRKLCSRTERSTIEGERIVAVEADSSAGVSERDLDGRGLLLIPGLIDMQCNGLCGHDVLDGSVTNLARPCSSAAAVRLYGSAANA